MTFLILGKNVNKNLRNMLYEVIALGSVFKNFEILFIDGNSTDGTRETFEEVVSGSSAKKIVFRLVPSDNLVETTGHLLRLFF